MTEEDHALARSLPFQAACIRDMLETARTPQIRAGAEGALATIIWLERNAEWIRMGNQLRMGRPDLYEILLGVTTAFPGSQIVSLGEAAE